MAQGEHRSWSGGACAPPGRPQKPSMIIGTYNILKTHTPISLYSCFEQSKRKALLLITPNHSHNFIYNASTLWNKLNTIDKFRQMNNTAVNIGHFKSQVKNLLLTRLRIGDGTDWSDENFILS